MLTRGQRIRLTIEKPAAGGRMIARVEGQVVLVHGVIPGERATVQIERLGKGVAYAEPLSIDEPSADRRAVDGDLACGGCLFAHIAYPRQVALKAEIIADAMNRIGKLAWSTAIPVLASPEAGYRMRARLHLRDGALGFFKEGTHTICAAGTTRQLLPATNEVLDAFGAAWVRSGLRGDGELELSENAPASERVLHFEPAVAAGAITTDWVTGLPGITGFTVADGGGARVVEGSPYVSERLTIDGRSILLRRHVLAFFQGNRHLLEPLVQRVAALVSPGETLLDLYAGVGLFAAAAASRGARVVAVEGDRASATDLEVNAGAFSGALEPVHQAVEEFLARRREAPRVVIVDPPRTGMSKEALGGAIELAAARVVYVSCDVATFARDARRLVDAGYRLDQVEGVDLFPNTPHVETIAVFER